MKEIVTNERAYVEQILNCPKIGSKPMESLSRIARYYYSEGYAKDEIHKLLEEYLLKCDPTFNLVKWQTSIDMVVGSASKYPLIDIQGVPITRSELKKIGKLRSKMLRKLMFTLLCLAKYCNAVNPSNNNWVNFKDKDIFSLANIVIATKRQSLLINDLWSMGYIGYSKMVDNTNLNVKIVDEDSPVDLVVLDYRNLGNQYLRYCGESHIECQICGKVIAKRSNRQLYCSECSAKRAGRAVAKSS